MNKIDGKDDFEFYKYLGLDKTFSDNDVSRVISENKNKSMEQEEIKYTSRKKVSSMKKRKAIVAALLVASLTFGGIKMANAAETAEVGSKISYYQSIMDSTDKPDENNRSIENFVSYNYIQGNDPIVSYEYWNNDNFYNIIMEASAMENPDVEVRCALIAAFKVINEPYREKQFKILFDKIKNNEDFINNTGFDGNKENIWQMLGYKDMEEFQENARKDTKELYITEKDGKNGKRM